MCGKRISAKPLHIYEHIYRIDGWQYFRQAATAPSPPNAISNAYATNFAIISLTMHEHTTLQMANTHAHMWMRIWSFAYMIFRQQYLWNLFKEHYQIFINQEATGAIKHVHIYIYVNDDDPFILTGLVFGFSFLLHLHSKISLTTFQHKYSVSNIFATRRGQTTKSSEIK